MHCNFFDREHFLVEENVGYSPMTNQHFHEQMEIYYLKKGEIAYFVDEAIYTVKEGDVIVLPPAVIHKTVDTRQLPRHRILINLPFGLLEELEEEGVPLWDSVSIFHTTNKERINRIFTELLEEYEGQRNPVLLKALMWELIVLLQRKTEIKSSVTQDSAHSKQVSEIIAYINQEYASDLTLQLLAERFFMNPSYLSRLFKKCTGLSFSDYLRKYRIKKALELMAGGRKNITEIAMDVGFHSTNHFCKTFRELIHESPLQYRKQHFARQKRQENG